MSFNLSISADETEIFRITEADAGWSPVPAIEQTEGDNYVLHIVEWVGGTGDRPLAGYLSPSGGIVQRKEQARTFVIASPNAVSNIERGQLSEAVLRLLDRAPEELDSDSMEVQLILASGDILRTTLTFGRAHVARATGGFSKPSTYDSRTHTLHLPSVAEDDGDVALNVPLGLAASFRSEHERAQFSAPVDAADQTLTTAAVNTVVRRNIAALTGDSVAGSIERSVVGGVARVTYQKGGLADLTWMDEVVVSAAPLAGLSYLIAAIKQTYTDADGNTATRSWYEPRLIVRGNQIPDGASLLYTVRTGLIPVEAGDYFEFDLLYVTGTAGGVGAMTYRFGADTASIDKRIECFLFETIGAARSAADSEGNPKGELLFESTALRTTGSGILHPGGFTLATGAAALGYSLPADPSDHRVLFSGGVPRPNNQVGYIVEAWEGGTAPLDRAYMVYGPSNFGTNRETSSYTGVTFSNGSYATFRYADSGSNPGTASFILNSNPSSAAFPANATVRVYQWLDSARSAHGELTTDNVKDIAGGLFSTLRGFVWDAVGRTISWAEGWIHTSDIRANTIITSQIRDGVVTPSKLTAALRALINTKASWTEADPNSLAYIENKPTLGDGAVDFLDYRADLNTTTNDKGIYRHEGAGWQGANAPADVNGQRVFEVHTHADNGVQYLILEEGAGWYTRPTPTDAWSSLQVSQKPPFNARRPFVLQARQEAPASNVPDFTFIDVIHRAGAGTEDTASNNRRSIGNWESGVTGTLDFDVVGDLGKTPASVTIRMRNGAETEADNSATYTLRREGSPASTDGRYSFSATPGTFLIVIPGTSVTEAQKLWLNQLGSVTGQVAATILYTDGTYSQQHIVSHPGLEVEVSSQQAAVAFQQFLTTLTAGQLREVQGQIETSVNALVESWALDATTPAMQRQGIAELINAATGEEQKIDYDTGIKGAPLLDFSGAPVGSVVISAGNDTLPQHILSNARSAGPTGTFCALRYNGGTQRGNSIVTFYVIDDTPITIGLPLQTGVIDIITVESREAETDIRLNRSGGNWTVGTYELRVLS